MSTTAFLTDSTLCIGCKGCEVACKEWNQLGEDGFEWSGNSYDNTMAVGHSTWRHVKFVENTPEIGLGGNSAEQLPAWGFSSDVCKHCEVACKEWNQLGEDGFAWSGNSYDNTMAVGHSTWRHVKFVENTPEIGLGG